jgi:hypothetical protein
MFGDSVEGVIEDCADVLQPRLEDDLCLDALDLQLDATEGRIDSDRDVEQSGLVGPTFAPNDCDADGSLICLHPRRWDSGCQRFAAPLAGVVSVIAPAPWHWRSSPGSPR